MASTIVTKNSSTASAVPLTGDLTQGELAVNVTDKRLFTKNSGGTVVELGINPSSLTMSGGTANGVAYLNGSKAVTTGSALTFDGTNLGVGGAAGNSTNYSTVTARGTSGGIYEFNAGGTLQSYILGNSSELRLQTQSTQAITFNPNGSEQMRLTSTGLGIGTSSPALKLHVVGAAVENPGGGSGSRAVVKISDTTSVAANNGGGIVFQGIYTGTTQVDAAGIQAYKENSTDGNYAYGLSFVTRANGGNLTANMKLDSSGNLGIGTSSPSGKVHVYNGSGTNATLIVKAENQYANQTASFQNISTVRTWDIGQNLSDSSTGSLEFYDRTGAATRMRLDSSGNLGLGVTPSAWTSPDFRGLQVGSGIAVYGRGSGDADRGGLAANCYNDGSWKYIATGNATRAEQSDGTHAFFTAASGTAGNAITFTQAMTLDASGRLGLGVTSPSLSFEVGINAAKGYMHSGVSVFSVGTSTNHPYGFDINGTEKARIDSSGNLLVGTTNSSDSAGVGFKLNVDAAHPVMAVVGSSSTNSFDTYHLYSTGAAAYRFYVGYGGTVYATSTTISAISDIRLKENVRDLDAGLAEIMELKPRLYDWKEGKGANIKNARGFIAQEFEQVFPDLIDEWKDPAPEGEEPYKSVRQDLIPVLVKAIQEQQALIQQLQADVAALKGA